MSFFAFENVKDAIQQLEETVDELEADLNTGFPFPHQVMLEYDEEEKFKEYSLALAKFTQEYHEVRRNGFDITIDLTGLFTPAHSLKELHNTVIVVKDMLNAELQQAVKGEDSFSKAVRETLTGYMQKMYDLTIPPAEPAKEEEEEEEDMQPTAEPAKEEKPAEPSKEEKAPEPETEEKHPPTILEDIEEIDEIDPELEQKFQEKMEEISVAIEQALPLLGVFERKKLERMRRSIFEEGKYQFIDTYIDVIDKMQHKKTLTQEALVSLANIEDLLNEAIDILDEEEED